MTENDALGTGAGQGGGIYLDSSVEAQLTDSEVSFNRADSDGGGIYAGLYSTVTLTNTEINGNTAGTFDSDSPGDEQFDGDGGNGGGIYAYFAAVVTEQDTTIHDNFSWDGNDYGGSGGGLCLVSSTFTITDTLIDNNTAGYAGGGAYISGNQNFEVEVEEESFTRVTITHNDAGDGGGILMSNAVAYLTDVTIALNTAQGAGGGVLAELALGTVHMNRVTVSGNQADSGGGIYLGYDDADIVNSTISGNIATTEGGGIYVTDFATAFLSQVTVAENVSAGGTGGIYTEPPGEVGGRVELTNSILANGSSALTPGTNCNDGSFTYTGKNLSDDGTCPDDAALAENVDPVLGPLTNNGGMTETHALLAGSPAIDAIEPLQDACVVDEDQRTVARPQGEACDIGAFEAELADVSIQKDEDAYPVSAGSRSATPSPSPTTATVPLSQRHGATAARRHDLCFRQSIDRLHVAKPGGTGDVTCPDGEMNSGTLVVYTLTGTSTKRRRQADIDGTDAK